MSTFSMRSPRTARVSRRRALIAATAVMAATAGGAVAGSPLGQKAEAAAVAADSCGYPHSAPPNLAPTVFNENTLTRKVQVYGTGLSAKIAVFAMDEWGILLGQKTGAGPAPTLYTPIAGQSYGYASNPSLGDLTGTDAAGRLLYPVLYITDITANPANRAGDWQEGGAHPTNFINDVFGTWTTATNPPYVATKPSTKNHWVLGPGSDVPTGGFTQANVGKDEGYGSEFRWNVNDPGLEDENGNALQPNHTYRVQVMSHDGDQNKNGGDVGELCTTITVPPTNVTTQVRDAATDNDITNTTVAAGTDVYDFATVQGDGVNVPTGKIDFAFYTNGSCTAPVDSTETGVTLTAQGNDAVASGTDKNNLAAGNYSFKAHYDNNGDTHYLSADGDCEPFSIGKATPDVTTEVHNPNHVDITGDTVVVGTTVHDQATVVGDGVNVPTGTVDFDYFDNEDCLGQPLTTDTGKTLSANGNNGRAESDNHTPNSPGEYAFLAHYDAGNDPNYNDSDGVCEPFTIEAAPLLNPSVVTHVRDGNGADITGTTVPANTVVHDEATVSGNGGTPTGVVNFNFYDNNTCAGNPVDTELNVPLVNGVASSSTRTPAPGQHAYLVSYNGDRVYTGGTGVCEIFTIANPPANPTLTTTATSLVSIPDASVGGSNPTIHDVATLTGGNNPTGTIEFKVYGPSQTSTPDCSAPPFATVSAPVAGTQAVSPSVTVSQVGYYFWTAQYSGDNLNNPSGPTACGDPGETSQAAQSDLGLGKIGLLDGSDPNGTIVQPGDAIHYMVSIPNSGNSDVLDAVVTDTLPAYVVVDVASISNGGVYTAGSDITQSAGTIVWTGVDIPAGTSTNLTYDVTVSPDAPQGLILENLVELGGLSATTDHQVASGKLTIDKSVDKSDAEFGDTLTYSLDVTAHGTLIEHGVTVTDYIPGYDPDQKDSGLTTYVDGSADCDPGPCSVTYDADKHQLTWELGTMNPGDTRTVTFQVTIDTPEAAADGAIPAETLYNAAAVASSENVDPVPSNRVKTVVTEVLGVKETRKPPEKAPELPFTGAAYPPVRGAAIGLALFFLGLATVTAVRRRREPLR